MHKQILKHLECHIVIRAMKRNKTEQGDSDGGRIQEAWSERLLWDDDIWKCSWMKSERETTRSHRRKILWWRKEQVHRPYGWNVHGRTEEQGDQCYWMGGRAGRAGRAWRHEMGEVARDLSQEADAAWQGSRDLTPRVMRGFWKVESRKWYDLTYSLEGRP